MGRATGLGPNAHVLKDHESYINPPLIRVRLLRTNKGKQALKTSRETQPLVAKWIG